MTTLTPVADLLASALSKPDANGIMPVLYTKPDEFYQGALRSAMRESLSLPVTLNEPQTVRIKRGFETACWSFQPPHKIFVGTKLFEKPNIRAGLTEEQLTRYVKNHYHHEQAHGLYTERSMPRIKKALAAIRAPFQTYNLFEDAYIENRYRREAEYQFTWLEYETLYFSDRVESLLLSLIQAEGDIVAVQDALNLWTPALMEDELPCFPTPEIAEPLRRTALKEKLPRVHWYYQKIIAVRNSMALMPLLNLWLDEFGRQEQQKNPGGMQDMAHSLEMGTNAQALENFEAGTLPVTPTGDKEEVRAQSADRNHEAVAQSADLLDDDAHGPLPKERIRTVADKLTRLFTRTPAKYRTNSPTSRLSGRHYAMGRPAYVASEKAPKKVRTIYLEVDCSGSMAGIHSEEGRILIAALSELAARGVVKGHVVLSGVLSGGKSGWQTFALPLADSVIERIEGQFGAEGLEYTLSANQRLAKAADFVFIYTDAQICDKPIDRAAWHSQGLYTWGLYAGEASERVLESMLEYFDKAVIRPTAEELVDAVLVQASKA